MEVFSWCCSPLSIYHDFFEKNCVTAAEKFKEWLYRHLAMHSNVVPVFGLWSLDSIPEGHLVCLYGMVQDMFNVELFVDKFTSINNGVSSVYSLRFRDFDDRLASEHIDIKFGERQSYYVVPIPGESSWVKKAKLRSRSSVCSHVTRMFKRPYASSDEISRKKPKSTDSVVSAGRCNASKCFPLIEEENQDGTSGALLRVYDNTPELELKLNDIIEVYGVLEHARLWTVIENEDCTEEEKCSEPLPRIHAIVVRKLSHNNPLINAICLKDGIPSDPTSLFDNPPVEIVAVRERLSTLLTDLFYGDTLLADYILLHLVSTSLPSSGSFPVNLPSLNIYYPLCDENVGSDHLQLLCDLVKNLSDFLSSLVCQFVTVNLTIESLNDGPCLMPIRDPHKGHLNAGRLQLASGTQLLINETQMHQGQLTARGLTNFRALNSLAVDQRVPYDFQFYVQPWDTPVRVLIMSTMPSLIKPVLSIPWQPKSTQPSIFKHVDDAEWNDMRKFLTIATFNTNAYSMDESLQELIHRDFVRWRQNESSYIEADDFAIMLCLLKFYCITHGVRSPTPEHWSTICSMEGTRRQRIANAKAEHVNQNKNR